MKTLLKLFTGASFIVIAGTAFGCSHTDNGVSLTNSPAGTPTVNAASPTTTPPQSPEEKMPRVSVEDAKKLVAEGKAIIIDVRGTEAYKTAHIKGALDIPLNKLEGGEFKELPKDKRIIAYCT
jgi:hypothetical protein